MSGKRVSNREKITQVSIGLHNRQHEFFENYPELDISKRIRELIDKDIETINKEYLK